MKFHIWECSFKITFDELIADLIKENINNFLNIKFDSSILTATFYKEMKRVEKTIDKDGKETLISFDYYLYQDFYFYKIDDRLFLVINEPNKYTKYFVDFISSCLKTKIAFKNKQINLKNLMVKARELNQFQVFKARFNELPLSKNSKGSLDVSSTQNAILDFESIFGDIYYDLSKIKFSYFDEFIHTIELSKSGLIVISKNTDVRIKTVSRLIKILFF
ncbi:hypothetical protein FY048_00295 [Acinetobacter sp. 1124_18A]|uniref:hypothetical protein n=1 Tax=Acinetobacter sp. 1124_18A TaxID=2605958 RepID=UPI0040591975